MKRTSLIIFAASFWSLTLGYKCENKKLKCLVDYEKLMTCCWSQNVSQGSSRCEVRVDEFKGNWKGFPKNCSRENAQERSCTISFKYFAAAQKFNITLLCNKDGLMKEAAKIHAFIPKDNVQLQPPFNLNVVNNTDTMIKLSWETKHEDLFHDKMEFEIRYKLETEPWKNAKRYPIQQNEREIQIGLSSLKADSSYVAQIRVRILDTKNYKSIWSKWSQTLKWKTQESKPAAAKFSGDLWIALSLSGILFTIAILLIGQLCMRRSRKKPPRWLSIPDPGKFFYELNSTYGGNFQKWIGTKFPASFSSTEELGTEISSVEISEIKDSQSFIKQNFMSDSSGFRSISDSSISSFANQGYFWCNYPSSYEAYPCKVYFSYNRDELGARSEKSESYLYLSSSEDSLYDSSLQYSPCTFSTDKQRFELDCGVSLSRVTGDSSEEEIDRPPREHGDPTCLPYPDHLASHKHSVSESHIPPNAVSQFPAFGSSDCFFGPHALTDMKDEAASMFISNGSVFEKAPDASCSQNGFNQQNPSVFKSMSLNLVQPTDAYLSLKEVQSKYSNQSI
ncbi:interleukin-2 receptor subunit beta-like [Hemitrygon akajei]|uniref:interleukin-2 receptor subunit beta-like n=1 Tax=Hemitrygon akajei TaxID=2704970 RepID=UPI003BF9844F